MNPETEISIRIEEGTAIVTEVEYLVIAIPEPPMSEGEIALQAAHQRARIFAKAKTGGPA